MVALGNMMSLGCCPYCLVQYRWWLCVCTDAFSSIIMKCFEQLVRTCLRSTLPNTLHPLSLANCLNSSTHSALTHLDKGKHIYGMGFIDYSSAFHPIVLANLVPKLRILGLNTSLCNWILDLWRQTPGRENGEPHLHYTYPEPWSPSRPYTQSPPNYSRQINPS